MCYCLLLPAAARYCLASYVPTTRPLAPWRPATMSHILLPDHMLLPATATHSLALWRPATMLLPATAHPLAPWRPVTMPRPAFHVCACVFACVACRVFACSYTLGTLTWKGTPSDLSPKPSRQTHFQSPEPEPGLLLMAYSLWPTPYGLRLMAEGLPFTVSGICICFCHRSHEIEFKSAAQSSVALKQTSHLLSFPGHVTTPSTPTIPTTSHPLSFPGHLTTPTISLNHPNHPNHPNNPNQQP